MILQFHYIVYERYEQDIIPLMKVSLHGYCIFPWFIDDSFTITPIALHSGFVHHLRTISHSRNLCSEQFLIQKLPRIKIDAISRIMEK